jgi:hypothetical protein
MSSPPPPSYTTNQDLENLDDFSAPPPYEEALSTMDEDENYENRSI